jgi:hypothetical protein
MFDILQKLGAGFEEKDVELILLILKSVGPSLRKDDPIALKNVIIQLQKQASLGAAEKYPNIAFSIAELTPNYPSAQEWHSCWTFCSLSKTTICLRSPTMTRTWWTD